jgi:hypothetical protein
LVGGGGGPCSFLRAVVHADSTAGAVVPDGIGAIGGSWAGVRSCKPVVEAGSKKRRMYPKKIVSSIKKDKKNIINVRSRLLGPFFCSQRVPNVTWGGVVVSRRRMLWCPCFCFSGFDVLWWCDESEDAKFF